MNTITGKYQGNSVICIFDENSELLDEKILKIFEYYLINILQN